MGNFLLEVKMCFIMLKYWGYSALYNATLHRLTWKNAPFTKSGIKRKCQFFFSLNFHTVFREQIAIFYQIFKSGSSKNFFKCPQFTKVRGRFIWNLFYLETLVIGEEKGRRVLLQAFCEINIMTFWSWLYEFMTFWMGNGVIRIGQYGLYSEGIFFLSNSSNSIRLFLTNGNVWHNIGLMWLITLEYGITADKVCCFLLDFEKYISIVSNFLHNINLTVILNIKHWRNQSRHFFLTFYPNPFHKILILKFSHLIPVGSSVSLYTISDTLYALSFQ